MKLYRGISLILALCLLLSLPAIAAAPETGETLRSDHAVYLHGYGDGSFRPNASLSRAEGASILYQLLADRSRGTGRTDYADVSDEAWYAEAVRTLASRGLLDGQGGAFRPTDSMTRGELVRLLAGLAGPEEADAEPRFSDLDADDPLYGAVALAVRRGWVQGYDDGCFRPDAPLTRAQAAAVFNRVLGRSADERALAAGDARRFLDVGPENWFYADVAEAAVEHTAEATESGELWTAYRKTYTVRFHVGDVVKTVLVEEGEIPSGIPQYDANWSAISRWLYADGSEADPAGHGATRNADYYAVFALAFNPDHLQYVYGDADGRFRPDDAVTRAQLCSMLCVQLLTAERGALPVSYSDVPEDAWYADAVLLLASHGILESGGAFGPGEAVTRGWLATLLSRLVYSTSAARAFTDLPAGEPLARAATAVIERGWMEADAYGAFRPDDAVTRAEAVTILNRVMGRRCDPVSAAQSDARFQFTDVPKDHPAFADIFEASTAHWYAPGEDGETWTRYWHKVEPLVPLADWEDSVRVANAAVITNVAGCDYLGDFTYDYNLDYSDGFKEAFINSRGYTSNTEYLIWVSRQNQKLYIFTGDGEAGNWKFERVCLVCTGALQNQTPVGVTVTHYKIIGWFTDHYACYPCIGFYPGSDFAFHSRLHAPRGYSGWYDPQIGRPASGGCIRMLDEDVGFINEYVPLDTTVVVY